MNRLARCALGCTLAFASCTALLRRDFLPLVDKRTVLNSLLVPKGRSSASCTTKSASGTRKGSAGSGAAAGSRSNSGAPSAAPSACTITTGSVDAAAPADGGCASSSGSYNASLADSSGSSRTASQSWCVGTLGPRGLGGPPDAPATCQGRGDGGPSPGASCGLRSTLRFSLSSSDLRLGTVQANTCTTSVSRDVTSDQSISSIEAMAGSAASYSIRGR